MNRLGRKIAILLILIMVLAIALNSWLLYRRITNFSNQEIRLETSKMAKELAIWLEDNIKKETVSEAAKRLIDLSDYQIAVVSATNRKILYTNTPGIRLKAIISDEGILGARAPILSEKGELLGTVVVLTKNSEISRLNGIFKTVLRSSLLLGGLVVVISILVLYLLVNKPLKQLMYGMEKDEIVEFKTNSDWYQISAIHNKAHSRRMKQKKEENEFFQNASHEIKSPLMNIQGYMEGLVDGLYPQEEAYELVVYESQRIKSLVDQMIRSSKAGNIAPQDIQYEWIDMEAFMQDMASMIPKQIQFVYSGNEPTFYFDRTLLQIIISNLVQNACRYAKEQIAVTFNSNEKNILTIKDDGPGIDLRIINQVFERFVKGQGGITGLGLSIVKSYVEATDGVITAANQEGALFTLTWNKTRADNQKRS